MSEQLSSILDHMSLFGLTLLAQVTFICGAALCLCWAFRRRPSARHFVALATVAAVALCPLLLFLPVARWCVLPIDVANTPTDAAPTSTMESVRAVPPLDQDRAQEFAAIERPNSFDRSNGPTFSGNATQTEEQLPTSPPQSVQRVQATTGIASASPDPTSQNNAGKSPAAPTVRVVSQPAAAPVDVAMIARQAIRLGVVAWLAGVVLLTLRFGWHVWRLRCIVAKCERTTKPVFERVMGRVVEELHLRQIPEVLTAESLTLPIVTGVFRPKVILSSAMVEQSSEEELHIVMSHECAHIARRDLWISLFQRFLTIVYWPHLFVHIINRHLSRAREELCDNHVLAVTSATAYAKTLLRLGEGAIDSRTKTPALPWIGRHWPLEERVSDLLNPNRRTETRVSRGIAFVSSIALLVVVTIAAGIAVSEKVRAQEATTPTNKKQNHDSLIKAMAERSAYWRTPASPELKTLEYTYLLGHNPQEVSLQAGKSKVRAGLWHGCTLYTGVHQLLRAPDRFSTVVTEDPGGQTLTVSAKLPTDDTENVAIEVGNGIDGSWRGYFSHSTREVVVTVDKTRLVPLEEKSGPTTVRYSEWQEVSPVRWVPRTIDVLKGKTHYRMHFEWAGNAAWLLTYAEAISRDGAETIARTKNVKVNDLAAMRELTAEEKRQDEHFSIMRRMLAKNQPWLDPNATAFDSIEYTFHTIREDIREQGYLNRDGTAVFEIVHDGQGKMKDRLGERRIVLPTKEVAYTHRDARFAKLIPRRKELKAQPADELYRHYARIGCQFDLPLFRFHERLKLARLEIEDGQWNGKSCDVARIKGLGRDVYLGTGTMFGFTSSSYVHHIRPVHELIYVDKETHLPIHESFVGTEPNRSFEIDFSDYVEVANGQWAPLSIRIESKDYFTAEYKFQVVQGKHWMLKEVVSWFDIENKSRGTIEDVAVNGESDLYRAAKTQVNASRQLFGEQDVDQQATVNPIPIVFGKRTEIGSYTATLTVVGPWNAAIKIETDDKDAPTEVPVLLLDQEHRLLFAKTVALSTEGDIRRGEAGLGSSQALGKIHSIVLPGASQIPGNRRSVSVSEPKWNESTKVNAADRSEPSTRVYELRLTRDDDGTSNAKLTVASHKGPAKFLLDLSVVLFDEQDQVIAAGMHNGTMLVKSGIVEEQFDIPLGTIADAGKAAKVAIAVTVGDVVSAPMGSTWGTFMRDGLAVPLEQLLSADDDACRKQGLQQLSGKLRLDKEFFDDQRNRDRLDERGLSRKKLLAPHVENIARISQQASDKVVLVEALRLLGHAGVQKHVNTVKAQLSHTSDPVADTAAIAAAMLGDASGFDRLRSIFARRRPSGADEQAARRAFDRLEIDAVIALASLREMRSIKLLGEVLEGDLHSLGLATHEKGHVYLTGRQDRIKRVVQVLGYCENEAAVPALLNTIEFFDEHPEIAEVFVQLPLVEALMNYDSKTRDAISSQISQGNYAYVRALKLNAAKTPHYVTAVREMVLLPDTDAWTAWQGVRYLWNVGSPEAVDVLRESYEKEVHKDDLRTRFTICEALADLGDDRGVRDAFEALTELHSMTDAPTEKDALRMWEDRREALEEGAEGIFGRASQKSLVKLIQSKLDTDEATQRRAVIETLWYVPETPTSVLPAIRRWQDDTNASLSEEITKLLDRE